MSGPRRQPQQTVLFDLDLEPDLAAEPDLDLAVDVQRDEGSPEEAAPEPLAEVWREADVSVSRELAPLRSRLVAAGVDLGCHVAVVAAGAAGAVMLGVPLDAQAAPGLTLLVVVFSLFFLVVPLAFWGRTAGMAAAGIGCRTGDDQPLTFGEAFRRWVGSLLTVVLAGLPALLVLAGGRSLADRLSGSAVVQD